MRVRQRRRIQEAADNGPEQDGSAAQPGRRMHMRASLSPAIVDRSPPGPELDHLRPHKGRHEGDDEADEGDAHWTGAAPDAYQRATVRSPSSIVWIGRYPVASRNRRME